VTSIEVQPAALLTDRALCAHCSLPVPRALLDPTAEHQFCCHGCRTVFEAIHACGLDRYYGLRQGLDAAPAPATPTGRRYEELDDPTFRDLYCRRRGEGGIVDVELYLEGVHCAACVWLVERLPQIVPGLAETSLDAGRSVVRVTWDGSRVKLSRIARQLDRLGYTPHPYRGRTLRDLRRAEDRRSLARIGVAGAAAGNVMLLAFALYGGLFHGMESGYATFFRWTSFLIAIVSLAWPGRVFFAGALAALRTRAMHMDVPVAVGLAAGALWSAVNTIRGTGEVYFDSLTVLIFLLLVGRWIQQRQQRSSHDAVELLFSMTPGTARVVDGDAVREVPAETLVENQVVEVRAGDAIPADGVVVAGSSEVDLSLLTGESKPVAVATDHRVHAGTTNLSSLLRVSVTATGERTRLGRLMKMIEQSAARRAPVVRLADRVAGIFVSVVLLLAAATALLWWRLDAAAAVPNAISLLIVTCPCALGLATPLAIVAAIGRAARKGILIKGGEIVERLNRPGLLLLDKTGTLTEGRTAIVDWHGPEELKSIAASVEAVSAHPVARAFVAALGDQTAVVPAVNVVETPGRGIDGDAGGQHVVIGARTWLDTRGIEVPSWVDTAEAGIATAARSPVLVAVDGRVQAVAGVGDPVKGDAAESIAALTRAGWRVGVLSGDHPQVVRAVAVQVGIDPGQCHGSVSPEQKQAVVEDAAGSGPVVMVGDGVNDAAALAAASVGVAVRGSAEASLSAADVYLAPTGLGALVDLLRGSRRTLSVIRRNLLVSLVYNVAGASLAIAGLINPLVAAVPIQLSSLTVITLSFGSRTFEVKPCR
jgi:Cu2+-exporting ATPase